MKIVLIDDSKSALAALDAAIGEIGGMETSTFADPEEALHHCLSSPVDLVIVDYTMPKYTGIELAEALKRNEANRYVPIVMVTSLTERAVRIKAIEAGVTEFLSKPFDPVELKARVRNLLALRRAHLELAGHAERLVLKVSHATAELMAREWPSRRGSSCGRRKSRRRTTLLVGAQRARSYSTTRGIADVT